jgi:NAD(P)-dependent dehydrogenase (short-subunit alcohol dehydrogenase family)
MSLQGKLVLVTGAASGVGREMVTLFLAEGAEVIAVDRVESVDTLAGEHVLPVRADVRVQADVDRAVAAGGRALDVLCNNAGVLDGMSFIDEATDEEWDRCIGVNAHGPFLFCRAAVPGMLANGGGVIINTASASGLRGGRAGAAYTASKFAVVGLTLNIAATLGDQGIRCNAICPGATATNIAEGVQFSERGGAFAAPRMPFFTIAEPVKVARAAVMLARDDAEWINGAIVPVDGGWLAY